MRLVEVFSGLPRSTCDINSEIEILFNNAMRRSHAASRYSKIARKGPALWKKYGELKELIAFEDPATVRMLKREMTTFQQEVAAPQTQPQETATSDDVPTGSFDERNLRPGEGESLSYPEFDSQETLTQASQGTSSQESLKKRNLRRRLHYEKMKDPVARENFRKRQKELRGLGLLGNPNE